MDRDHLLGHPALRDRRAILEAPAWRVARHLRGGNGARPVPELFRPHGAAVPPDTRPDRGGAQADGAAVRADAAPGAGAVRVAGLRRLPAVPSPGSGIGQAGNRPRGSRAQIRPPAFGISWDWKGRVSPLLYALGITLAFVRPWIAGVVFT